tara:strand:- start:12 stop:716 length:705 start_codon:yes stop_codon:yes gene_type:complete
MFDEITSERLQYYVYTLVNPKTNIPFYIGKGNGNRVFMHKEDALKGDEKTLKLDTIRDLKSQGLSVNHIIIRHGLTEKESFEVEASLIDFGNYFGFNLSNIVQGQHSENKGLMTSDEIIRLFNAKPLYKLDDPVIIININKKYKRGSDSSEIYNATKQSWKVSASRIQNIKYALSEYEGIIIEVYKINEWYEIDNRWGFNGEVAENLIREKYINKSIAHTKKKGAANPVRYTIK